MRKRRIALQEKFRPITPDMEKDLAAPDDVFSTVAERDERQALRAWASGQGRDGEILDARLDGLSALELAEVFERSAAQIRRVLAEMARRARERFRG